MFGSQRETANFCELSHRDGQKTAHILSRAMMSRIILAVRIIIQQRLSVCQGIQNDFSFVWSPELLVRLDCCKN